MTLIICEINKEREKTVVLLCIMHNRFVTFVKKRLSMESIRMTKTIVYLGGGN